jgi:hypothetical protein
MPCAILVAMFRRAQALVLVLALLATPLALYARGIAGDMSSCNGMCCLPQHHHAAHPAPSEQAATTARAATTAEPECHHHSASATKASATQHLATETAAAVDEEASHSCAFHCAMHSRQHTMNFGLLAPIAPTKPSDLAAIRVAIDTTIAAAAITSVAPSGFLASPFEPPRA